MKISRVFILMLLLSSIASAKANNSSECPKLDGAYTCQWSDWIEQFGWEISLDKDDTGDVVYRNSMYSFGSDGRKTDYISGDPADYHVGQTLASPDGNSRKNLSGHKLTYSCKNQKLLLTTDYFDKKGKQYKEEIVTYYLGSDGNLAATSLNPHHSMSCVATNQQFHAISVMSTGDLVKDLPNDIGAADSSKKQPVSGQTLIK